MSETQTIMLVALDNLKIARKALKVTLLVSYMKLIGAREGKLPVFCLKIHHTTLIYDTLPSKVLP